MPRDSSKDRVGPYKLGKRIGEGAFSVVRSAQHVETKDKAAIKILDKKQLAEDNAEADVMTEIAIMAQIQHKNVVNLKEVLTSRDNIYLVMEKVKGGTIFDRVTTKGPYQDQEARIIMKQLLDALEFCHMNGVIHRDIKASNVLLAGATEVKLADFGLGALNAFYMDEESDTGVLTKFGGTANYAAPEVFAGREYSGAPADIWSLGCLLHFMTAGKPAFLEPSFSALQYRISKAAYWVPLWLKPALVDFLSKMLVPNPNSRATIAELKKHHWLSGDDPSVPIADPYQNDVPQIHRAAAPGSPLSPRQPYDSMNAFELMASALDISSILEERADRLQKCHFTSRKPPSAIWHCLEAAMQSKDGIVKVMDHLWRGQIQHAHTPRGPVTADVEINTIHENLIIVSFVPNCGSQSGFYHLFNFIIEHKACAPVIQGSVKRAPSDTSPSSQLSSPISPLLLRAPLIPSIEPLSRPSTSAENSSTSRQSTSSLPMQRIC